MAVGDRGQCCVEISEGLYTVILMVSIRDVIRPQAMPPSSLPAKSVFLPLRANGAHQVFDSIGVDLDAPAVQECLQTVAVIMDICQLFAKTRFAGYLAALGLPPLAEGSYQRSGLGLTSIETLAGRDATDFGFD